MSRLRALPGGCPSWLCRAGGALALLAVLLLSACATTPPMVSGAAGQGAGAATPEKFDVQGRLGVRYAGKGQSAGFAWEHRPDSDHIALRSPIGSIVAELNRDAGGVTLTRSDGSIERAADIESLTRAALGWPLPMAGLQFWIAGRPVPDVPDHSERDSAGHLLRLEQQGWLIVYGAYPETASLPGRITMTRDDLEIRLVVDEWRLLE